MRRELIDHYKNGNAYQVFKEYLLIKIRRPDLEELNDVVQ